MKIIEVIADKLYHETIKVIAEHHQIDDVWFGAQNEDGRNYRRHGYRSLAWPQYCLFPG